MDISSLLLTASEKPKKWSFSFRRPLSSTFDVDSTGPSFRGVVWVMTKQTRWVCRLLPIFGEGKPVQGTYLQMMTKNDIVHLLTFNVLKAFEVWWDKDTSRRFVKKNMWIGIHCIHTFREVMNWYATIAVVSHVIHGAKRTATAFIIVVLVPSRELTYPPKMAFWRWWRWFSFSQGGIC